MPKGDQEKCKSRILVPALDQAVLTKICNAVGIHKSKGHSILTILQAYD